MEMNLTIEKLENKVIQREEFNIKVSHRYNIPIQMNHHQNLEEWYQTILNPR